MGQRLGRLPESREALQTEHRRVIHWSAEVLAWVDENVEGEDSFLVDYDNDAIEAKVDTWLEEQRFRIEAACTQKPEYSTDLSKRFIELGYNVKYKMRKGYKKAYETLQLFGETVDRLAANQRNIHCQLLCLDMYLPNEESKFRKELIRLRKKVFKNLRKSEKMVFRDKRLKTEFIREVYDVDIKNMKFFAKGVQYLLRDFQESADII